MMWFKNNTNTTVAKIQQGALVLYIPHAQTPCLWRMALAELHAAQFLIADGANNNVLLQCQMPNTPVQIIASFDNKTQAQETLNKILQALFKGVSGAPTLLGGLGMSVESHWSIGRVIKWFLIIIFTLIVLIVGRGLFSDSSSNATTPMTTAKTASAASATEQLEPGKPMNADDILQNLGQ